MSQAAPGLDHLVLSWQIDPQLEAVQHLVLRRRRHLAVDDTPPRRHPLHAARSNDTLQAHSNQPIGAKLIEALVTHPSNRRRLLSAFSNMPKTLSMGLDVSDENG